MIQQHCETFSSNDQGGSILSVFSADTTGTESIYTVYEGHEIMFHISTMLPYSAENKQQVSQPIGGIKVSSGSKHTVRLVDQKHHIQPKKSKFSSFSFIPGGEKETRG